MKEHPLLLNADTVRAILDGRKTQTRLIIKPQPKTISPPIDAYYNIKWKNQLFAFEGDLLPYAPYQVGDKLYVREAVRPICYPYRDGKFNYGAYLIEYMADNLLVKCPDEMEEWWEHNWHIRPSTKIPNILMPKLCARTWLTVTGGRVERVQDISPEDIIAEGVTFDLIENMLPPTKTKQGHWISGGDYDQSLSYCFECAAKIVKKLNEGQGEYVVDGGWENHGSDYSEHCEDCDFLLNYWPTDHCLETELDGFEQAEGITELSNEDRYSFKVICGAAPDRDKNIQSRVMKLCWRYLWESIYPGSWERNDWVLVREFSRSKK